MASRNYFSHNSADGTSPSTRITGKFGYPSGFVGENIAAGQQTVLAVCAAWMCSSGHRTNILRCGFDTLGSGVAVNACCFQVRDLLDARLWVLQGRRRVQQLRGDAAAASEPGADAAKPGPAARRRLPTQSAPPPPPPSPTAPPATTKPPCSSAAAAASSSAASSSSSSSSSSSAGSPVTKFSGVDRTPRRRDLVAANRRRLGAGWPVGQDVRFQALKFSPSATGDYGWWSLPGPLRRAPTPGSHG